MVSVVSRCLLVPLHKQKYRKINIENGCVCARFIFDLTIEILYNYKKIYVGGNLHFLRGLLSAIFTVGIMYPGFCGVGQVDTREYVDWSQPPYNVFVHLSAGGHACTAQYVAKNLIVSAGHCTEDRPNKYEAYNYKKQTFPGNKPNI